MAKSINKNHPENQILPNFDKTIYHYNGFEWVKSEPMKQLNQNDEWVYTRPMELYKIYDKASIPTIPEAQAGDYLATYTTHTNYILGSEKLKETAYWKSTGLTIIQNQTMIMPNNGDLCYAVYTNKTTARTSHNISQDFIVKADNYYALSFFVKLIPEREESYVGLSIFTDTYHYSINCKFNINTVEGYVDNYKILPQTDIIFRDEEGNEVENIGVFSDFSAGIQLIPVVLPGDEIDYYFRPFIITKINHNTIGSFKIINLDHDGNWEFAENSIQYGNYMSGIQAEIVKVRPTYPGSYIQTENNKAKKRTFQKLYSYVNNAWQEQEGRKIHYLQNVMEEHLQTQDQHQQIINYTTIEKSIPTIVNAKSEDIAVVSSMVTFTTDKLHQTGEISGVKLGNNYKESDPLYTIYYDEYAKCYKLKAFDTGAEVNRYVKLKESSETHSNLIAKSLIYNQGYFETYHERSNFIPSYLCGYNTGGSCNFWKSHYLFHY